MWALIKSDFEYCKYRTLTSLWIIPGYYIYSVTSGQQSWFVVPSILSVSVVIQVLIERNMEKRERLHILLPVPIRGIGFSRLAILLFPFVGIIGLYLILQATLGGGLPPWTDGGIDLVMFFGLGLLAFSFYFLLRDLLLYSLKHMEQSGIDAIFMLITARIVIFGIAVALTILFKKNPMAHQALILLLFFVGLNLLYPTLWSFARRKSYLE